MLRLSFSRPLCAITTTQCRNLSSSPTMITKDFVDEHIKNHKVVVFAKSDCPFSKKAKATLEAQNLKTGVMDYINIDERPDFNEIKEYLKSLTGAGSTPRVFIGQKFYGGGDDTVDSAKDGKLAARLREAGAI